MREVPLVDSEETLGSDGLIQAVKHTFVQVASLVVHPGHDGVCGFLLDRLDLRYGYGLTWRVHHATHDKSTCGAAR